ncbi:MAG: ABC transporter substrate-binding protein [Methylococcaceae bacterium]|jgi:NitT/TauT family transport system substrate-binding protein
MVFRIFFFGIILLLASLASAAEKTPIKIGVLAFGTLDWELTALREDSDTENTGFKLDIQRLANPEAGKIALQSAAVDVIVSDWIWVARQRSTGIKLSFYPYSTSAGALIVGTGSGIKSIQDLKGKRLGIAGGELDKNWLLLLALGAKQNLDLNSSVSKVFGAPPLLNQQLKQNGLDAVLTYWNFAARLEAEGYTKILDGKNLMQDLGINANLATLGYVFREDWANANKAALVQFFNATKQAKNRLCTDLAVWQKIVPVSQENTAENQAVLRQNYCAGRIENWGENERLAAEQLYQLLFQYSHHQLTGDAEHLPAGTFWANE